MTDAEELLEHRQVEEGGLESERSVGEAACGQCSRGEKQGSPVGGEESGRSGCGKVGGGAGAAKRDEDDEAADDAEAFHAKVAVRHRDGGLELRIRDGGSELLIVVLPIPGVVEVDDGKRGDAPEGVEGLQP